MFQSRLPLRLLAPAILLAVTASAAPAEDLAMPSGEAWWHRLAQCGGLTLYLRDVAEHEKKPSTDIYAFTQEMNSFLAAASARLAKDRGIEESPAKRTVYQTAGAWWDALQSGREAAPDGQAELGRCRTDLAALPQPAR